MPIELSANQLRLLRLRSQRLEPRSRLPALPPEGVVGQVVALQAQDAAAAALSLWARSPDLSATDVEQARSTDRTLVRTWLLRGTLHLLASADLGWMLPLLGPVFAASDSARRAQLGLDDSTCTRGLDLLRQVLTGQPPLTRERIVPLLAEKGLPLAGQAVPHLLALAAFQGILCLGPDQKNKPTYVLLDEWLPGFQATLSHPEPRSEALSRLARRYLRAYAPAAPADLAKWSGLLMPDVRSAWDSIAGDLAAVTFDGRSLWLPKARLSWLDGVPRGGPRGREASRVTEQVPLPPEPSVRLLPAFDTYLLGYASRDLAIAPRFERRLNAGGGILHPVVLVDGLAVASWRLERSEGRGKRLELSVDPFEPLVPAILSGLESESAVLSRFLNQPVDLVIRTF